MITVEGRGSALQVQTFDTLDRIVAILGDTKLSFYPFLSAFGTTVSPYGAGTDGVKGYTSDEVGAKAIESEFDPLPLVGGVHALYFGNLANNHINLQDFAAFSHGNGTVDTPVSWGAWIMPTEALGTARTIMAKYGLTANLEEYDFRFDTSGNLELELHDASASAKEIGVGASDVLVPYAWNFVVATYDGAQAAPVVHLYRNGVDTLAAGITTETGAYVAMEDTAAGFLIGARDATGTPKQEFEGYKALPFMTGKELTAAEVASLYALGKRLIGI